MSASDAGRRSPAGELTVAIADERVDITMSGGGSWEIPLGPVTLCQNELSHDPPKPAELTNALGFIHDYFDDIVIAAPTVLATPSVVASGRHAEALGHVELGHTDLPADYVLRRTDADEVFRTLVAESRTARLANPGLDAGDVDTVIGVLCIVLAIMRRLDLGEIAIISG